MAHTTKAAFINQVEVISGLFHPVFLCKAMELPLASKLKLAQGSSSKNAAAGISAKQITNMQATKTRSLFSGIWGGGGSPDHSFRVTS